MTENWKDILTTVLEKLGVLNKDTEQVIVNVNNGKVCDIKRTERHK